MRPSIDRAQAVVPGAGHPRTPGQRTLVRGVLRLSGSPVGKAVYRLATPPVTTIALPDYPARMPVRS